MALVLLHVDRLVVDAVKVKSWAEAIPVGLALFALRYIIPPQRWPDKLAKLSFWSLNIGLAWMVFATLLPLGVLQLWHSVNDGYYEARTLGYITQPGNVVLEWLRMPGDFLLHPRRRVAFRLDRLAGGWLRGQGDHHRLPAETLFVEEHPEAEEDRTGLAVTGGGRRRPTRPTAVRCPTTAKPGRIRDRGRRDRRVADDRIRRLLVVVAYGIDTFARRTAAKVEQRRSGTFVYHEDHDAW